MVSSDTIIKEELASRRTDIDPLYERDIQPPSVDLGLHRQLLDFTNSRSLHADVNNDLDDPSEVAEIKYGEPCHFSCGFSEHDVPRSGE